MMHTRFALRRPVTTLMTFIAIALIGAIATRLLPLELFPDIRFPGIQVTIPYAGSTPEEVEQLITRPAEEAIATLSGIKEIRSTSSEAGAEMIVLQANLMAETLDPLEVSRVLSAIAWQADKVEQKLVGGDEH